MNPDLIRLLWILFGSMVVAVIIRQLIKSAKSEGPQKNGDQHWNDYVDRTKAKTYQKGTQMGKAAVQAFVDALDIRVNGDEHDRTQAKDIFMKHMMYHFYFYKWLAEYTSFDPEANPRNNVPVLTIYKAQNGAFRFCTNIIGHKAHQQFELKKHLEAASEYMEQTRFKTMRKRIKGQLN